MSDQTIEIIGALCDSLDNLSAVLCSIEPLADSVNKLADALQAGTIKPLAIEPEFIVAALKAAWLKTYPNHTEMEYIEAMRRIEILAGL